MAKGVLVAALVAFGAASLASTSKPHPEQHPATAAVYGKETSQGCFASVGSMGPPKKQTFNSPGVCSRHCGQLGQPVAALQGTTCLCGNTYPPASALTSDDKCSQACPGYAFTACGGASSYYSVYNVGLELDVANDPEETTYFDRIWNEIWDKASDLATTIQHSIGWTSPESEQPATELI